METIALWQLCPYFSIFSYWIGTKWVLKCFVNSWDRWRHHQHHQISVSFIICWSSNNLSMENEINLGLFWYKLMKCDDIEGHYGINHIKFLVYSWLWFSIFLPIFPNFGMKSSENSILWTKFIIYLSLNEIKNDHNLIINLGYLTPLTKLQFFDY